MTKTKQINIGLIGIGTIGSGVVKILNQDGDLIEKRTGIKINLKKVCDLNFKNAKKLGLKKQQFTKNYKDLINAKGIDIILELIGGYEPAREIIITALKNKKNVVTANKAVIAKYGTVIFELAKNNNVSIGFEAAVAGCIPIIKTITESYTSERIEKIYGILNGTANFILTKMEEGMPYDKALKQAQEFGFAEQNPSFDVEGKDALQKLIILASLAFNAKIDEKDENIFCKGITKIDKKDLEYANELGYKIKLLAVAKHTNNELELRVHPVIISKEHELSAVKNELNAVYIVGKNTTKSMLYGKGAGQLPTATVILGDIIDIAKGKQNIFYFEDIKIKEKNKVESRYYLRYQVIDKPGVLAKIAKILGDNNISIAEVQQKETNKEIVSVIMTTHQAVEENLVKAVNGINKLDIIKEKTIVVRIEEID